MQITPSTYRKVSFMALVALIVIIITGGAVRLTGSGLGCSDWPTCEENQFVADLEYHALVEFVNRVITGITGIAVILAVLGALILKPRQRNLIWWAWGLVAGVLGQVILGAFVVKSHLTPTLVMMHFLLSMVLVYNAVALHHKTDPDFKPNASTHKSIIWLTRAAALLSIGAIFTGTLLTSAGPHGGDDEVERFNLDISNLAQIHAGFVIALLSVMALGWLSLYFFHQNSHANVWKKGKLLLVVALAQGLLGYIQYFSDVPEILVGFHIAGAAGLWTAMVYFYLATCPPRKMPAEIPAKSEKIWR